MENQFYVSQNSQVITLNHTRREAAVRERGTVEATDYYFDVTIDGKPEHVRVTVQAEATTVLERWLADPANLHRIGRAGEVEELTVDFCAARILEALDKRIDLTKEDSFLVIQGAPPALEKLPTPIVTENIREYISRRLYAAWGECGEDISCCQLFTRIDWLYLKVTQRDLRRVIDLHIDELWTEEVQDQMYLKATRSLIKDLERPRKREPAVLTPFYLPSSAAPVSTGQATGVSGPPEARACARCHAQPFH
jgi:hypothetical protein